MEVLLLFHIFLLALPKGGHHVRLFTQPFPICYDIPPQLTAVSLTWTDNSSGLVSSIGQCQQGCRILQGISKERAGSCTLPKPALHCILLIRTWHGVYTVTICCAAREKGRSCEAFQGCVQFFQSWQTWVSPCLGACGGAADYVGT